MKSSNTSSKTSKPETTIAAQPSREAKIHQLLRWVLAGASEFEIAEAVAAQWPDTDVRPLLADVVTHLIESGEPSQQIVLGWAIEATKYLYQRMVDIGDFAGALRAVKQIHELSRTTRRNGAVSPPGPKPASRN